MRPATRLGARRGRETDGEPGASPGASRGENESYHAVPPLQLGAVTPMRALPSERESDVVLARSMQTRYRNDPLRRSPLLHSGRTRRQLGRPVRASAAAEAAREAGWRGDKRVVVVDCFTVERMRDAVLRGGNPQSALQLSVDHGLPPPPSPTFEEARRAKMERAGSRHATDHLPWAHMPPGASYAAFPRPTHGPVATADNERSARHPSRRGLSQTGPPNTARPWTSREGSWFKANLNESAHFPSVTTSTRPSTSRKQKGRRPMAPPPLVPRVNGHAALAKKFAEEDVQDQNRLPSVSKRPSTSRARLSPPRRKPRQSPLAKRRPLHSPRLDPASGRLLVPLDSYGGAGSAAQGNLAPAYPAAVPAHLQFSSPVPQRLSPRPPTTGQRSTRTRRGRSLVKDGLQQVATVYGVAGAKTSPGRHPRTAEKEQPEGFDIDSRLQAELGPAETTYAESVGSSRHSHSVLEIVYPTNEPRSPLQLRGPPKLPEGTRFLSFQPELATQVIESMGNPEQPRPVPLSARELRIREESRAAFVKTARQQLEPRSSTYDPSVSSEVAVYRQERAAVKIQTAARRYLAMTQAQSLRETNAAIILQRQARGRAGRKAVRHLREDKAVRVLQAHARGMAGRRAAETQRKTLAAIVLQSYARGMSARRRAQRQREEHAAVKIQAQVRGTAARKQAQHAREERAAVAIQSRARGMAGRKITQRKREEKAAVVVQAQVRGRAGRKAAVHRKQEHAAVKIQARVRGRQGRQVAAVKKQEKAAVKIQARVRGRAGRAEAIHKREERAATVVQAQVRGRIGRRAVAEKRAHIATEERAATTIQSRARGVAARQQVAQLRKEKKAAVTLQAHERGRQVRARVERDKQSRAATKIQARVRGTRARRQVMTDIENDVPRRKQLTMLAKGSEAPDRAVSVAPSGDGLEEAAARRIQRWFGEVRAQRLVLTWRDTARAALVIQRTFRGHLVREDLKRSIIPGHGMMKALKGTTQGESGWYREGDLAFFFAVRPLAENLLSQPTPLDEMDWQLHAGPMEYKAWKSLRKRVKKSTIMLAMEGTVQGETGIYINSAMNLFHATVDGGNWDVHALA